MSTSSLRHHRTWIYATTGLVVGIGGTLLSLYLVRPHAPFGMMGERYMPMSPASGVNSSDRWGMMNGRSGMMATSDQHFLAMMIPHHEDAVAMADLALQRAQHPEIKQLANAIKTSQTQEIKQMGDWYQQWYKAKPADFAQPRMMRGHMQTDLTALKNAKDFDREFILQMIPHHQMAVMMSARFMNTSQHPEIKTLTQNIIDSQSKEIEQMQGWYQSWYEVPAK